MSIITKAREFAMQAHKDQKYGNLPYAYHLQQVASRVELWRDRGALSCFPAITDTHVAVAWLHDVLEDTEVRHHTLHKEFGLFIADTAYILSKNYARSDSYISGIRANPAALIIKVADTLCNLEASIYSGELKRINKYSKQLQLLTEGL